jgi:hypothetical protein
MGLGIQKAGHLLKICDLKHSEVGERRRNGKAAGRIDLVVTGKGDSKEDHRQGVSPIDTELGFLSKRCVCARRLRGQ